VEIHNLECVIHQNILGLAPFLQLLDLVFVFKTKQEEKNILEKDQPFTKAAKILLTGTKK